MFLFDQISKDYFLKNISDKVTWFFQLHQLILPNLRSITLLLPLTKVPEFLHLSLYTHLPQCITKDKDKLLAQFLLKNSKALGAL